MKGKSFVKFPQGVVPQLLNGEFTQEERAGTNTDVEAGPGELGPTAGHLPGVTRAQSGQPSLPARAGACKQGLLGKCVSQSAGT